MGTAVIGSWQGKGAELYVQGNDNKTTGLAFGDKWTVYFNGAFSFGTRRRTCVVDAPNKTAFYRTGATTNQITTNMTAITKTTDQPLALFGRADITNKYYGAYFTRISKAKIYRCKIWEDGNLVHDYKPCVKGGVAGFKDTVDGAFVEGEAKTAADRLTYGGIEKTLYYKDGTEKGKRVTMADGSTMNWRKVSSSADKSPAVDIDIERSNDHGELVTQKIHFTKR